MPLSLIRHYAITLLFHWWLLLRLLDVALVFILFTLIDYWLHLRLFMPLRLRYIYFRCRFSMSYDISLLAADADDDYYADLYFAIFATRHFHYAFAAIISRYFAIAAAIIYLPMPLSPAISAASHYADILIFSDTPCWWFSLSFTYIAASCHAPFSIYVIYWPPLHTLPPAATCRRRHAGHLAYADLRHYAAADDEMRYAHWRPLMPRLRCCMIRH